MLNLGRILTGLASLAAVLVGVALGAPALMTWEHLRAPVEKEARALLGVPVRVDGRITVQLFPAPRLSLGNVVIEPQPGQPLSGDFARARVHLKFWPLLTGRAVPGGLAFSGADLLADRNLLAKGAGLGTLSLPVSVQEGRVRFEADAAPVVTDLAFNARPRQEKGAHVRLSGSFEDTPFSARLVVHENGGPTLHSAGLDFGKGQAFVSFVRAEPAAGGGAEIRIKLKRGAKAVAFLSQLIPALRRFEQPEQLAQLAPLAVALRAVPEKDAFALRGLEVTAGPVRLTGGGRFRPGARPGVDLELGARTLVLGEGESGFGPSGLLRVLGLLAEWGANLDGSLRLHADHVLVGGKVMRRSEIRLSFSSEGTRLDRFTMDLPGGFSIAGQGIAAERGQLAAAVRLDGMRSGDLMDISGAAEPRAPGNDVPLKVEGQLVLSGARASLTDARITAGRNSIHAEGVLFFGERTALDLRLDTDGLDLRPWGLAYEHLTSGLSVNDLWNRVKALAARADLTARVELGTVRLIDATLRDTVLDLALDGKQVVLRRLSIEEEGGRAMEARLRMPLVTESSEGAADVADWTAHAEAAIDIRPADAGSSGLAWRAGLWDGVLSVETEAPLRSRLSGKLTPADEGFRWSGIEGRVGKAVLRGELAYVPGERPMLRGKVHARSAVVRLAGGKGDALWPDWPLVDYWPRGIDIHLDWQADELTAAGGQVTDAEGTVVFEENMVRLTLVSGTLYGGAATGSAALTIAPDGTTSWESQGVVQRADLAVLMGGDWQGRGRLRQSTSGSGTTIAEIVSGMRGTVGLAFEEGRIGGFNAASLANSLAKRDGEAAIETTVKRAFGAGTTTFRRLEGEAKIGNGELVLSGISAQTETGPVMLSGVVNLPARLIAAQADISLGDKIGAPLSVQFIGRMEAPERMVDTERLEKRLTQ